jgi:hypothetical protein
MPVSLLTAMLRVLSWAMVPAWPLAAAAAVLWTARLELLLLTVASTGSIAGLALLLMRLARERAEEYARLGQQRASEYARLEQLLVGGIVDLHPRGKRDG